MSFIIQDVNWHLSVAKLLSIAIYTIIIVHLLYSQYPAIFHTTYSTHVFSFCINLYHVFNE